MKPGVQLPEHVRHSKSACEQAIQQPKESPAARIAQWRWKPGQSGNPSGRPKQDAAADIARAIFENNPEAVYRALAKRLLKGDAYAFKELAERGYGKLKETVEVKATEELVADLLAGREYARKRNASRRAETKP